MDEPGDPCALPLTEQPGISASAGRHESTSSRGENGCLFGKRKCTRKIWNLVKGVYAGIMFILVIAILVLVARKQNNTPLLNCYECQSSINLPDDKVGNLTKELDCWGNPEHVKQCSEGEMCITVFQQAATKNKEISKIIRRQCGKPGRIHCYTNYTSSIFEIYCRCNTSLCISLESNKTET